VDRQVLERGRLRQIMSLSEFTEARADEEASKISFDGQVSTRAIPSSARTHRCSHMFWAGISATIAS
jgi:hypothetical protein